jgi:hypothetical protein
MSTTDVISYIKFKTLEYKYFKLINDDLWEQYKEDFSDFTEPVFRNYIIITVYNLRALLRNQGVWVVKDKRVIIAQSLYNILYKEYPAK